MVSVATGESAFIGPFATDIYNQSDGGAGQIYVDYSEVANVNVAALLMP
jgi:hypothetical protein